MLAEREKLDLFYSKRGKEVEEGIFNALLFRFRDRTEMGGSGDFGKQAIIQVTRIHSRRQGREEKPEWTPVTPLCKYFEASGEERLFPIFQLPALIIEEIKEMHQINILLGVLAILLNG